MGLSWTIEDRDKVSSSTSSVPQNGLGQYRASPPAPRGKVLRLEIPIPSASSVAFLLPIVALHAALGYFLANDRIHAFARKIAPIAVEFLPSREHEPPPEPPLLPAAALTLETSPLLQILPPSVAIDSFESETNAIAATFIAAKKELPEEKQDEIDAIEEDGTFVRPRPIKTRSGSNRYPLGSAAAEESGQATVKICITARGIVEKVSIIKSTGFERLDEDALDIARGYEFRPATRNGKAIPVCLPYSVTYRIR